MAKCSGLRLQWGTRAGRSHLMLQDRSGQITKNRTQNDLVHSCTFLKSAFQEVWPWETSIICTKTQRLVTELCLEVGRVLLFRLQLINVTNPYSTRWQRAMIEAKLGHLRAWRNQVVSVVVATLLLSPRKKKKTIISNCTFAQVDLWIKVKLFGICCDFF